MSDDNVMQLGAIDTWEGKRFIDRDVSPQFTGMSANSTAPGESSPFWHRHTAIEELYVFLDGTGEMALDDEIVPLTAGTVVRVSPGVWHALHAMPDSPVPLKWLCTRGAGKALADVGKDAELDRERPYPWS